MGREMPVNPSISLARDFHVIHQLIHFNMRALTYNYRMLKKYPIIRVNWQLSYFSWAKKPSDNILFEMITWLKIYHLSSAPHHNPSLAVSHTNLVSCLPCYKLKYQKVSWYKSNSHWDCNLFRSWGDLLEFSLQHSVTCEGIHEGREGSVKHLEEWIPDWVALWATQSCVLQNMGNPCAVHWSSSECNTAMKRNIILRCVPRRHLYFNLILFGTCIKSLHYLV